MSNQGYYQGQGAPQYPQQRVIKRRRKTPKPFSSTLKLRKKLPKTEIGEDSDLTQISKRNAVESPLLRLPGEIRNMIWQKQQTHSGFFGEASSQRESPDI
ncbi:hypothetical protein COCVIDRAFT_23734 [Bipolaris victoriae FI3]|uniref:Uncharacterized protein n=1 Tax=Bipolaris victoriae (strain FI3) TaxID=930091 RepID=W7EIC5_BIPV3|nr:hypothetical protein COCVIDRAFT_23734 [Bipolaris victoriae FI3]